MAVRAPSLRSGGYLGRLVDLLGERDQLVEDLGVAVAQVRFGESAVVRERLAGVPDGQVRLDHAGSARGGDLSDLGLCPDGAEHPGAGADDRDGLAPEGVVTQR